MLPQPNAEQPAGLLSRISSEGSIHLPKSELKNLENKIDTLGTKVDELGTKVDGLKDQVEVLGGKIDGLGQKVDQGFENLGRTVETGFQALARQNEIMVVILQQIQATNLQILAGNQQLVALLTPRQAG